MLRGGYVAPFVIVAGLILLGAGEVSTQMDQAFEDIEQYRAARAEFAREHRRIIFNNDGDDHLVDGEASVQAFLDRRSSPIPGTQVDAISYCTSRPFGMFTHNTSVGDVLTTKTGFSRNRNNIVPDLIEMGTDPLQIMTGFCHEHDMDVFWSMRMNDTHDAYHDPDGPQYYWSSFKANHPELLFGTRQDPPAYGAWSAVDYASPLVRELLFDVFEEICTEYDVDGVEMDFFRHLVFFRTVAEGGVATDEEREMMTDVVRRMREMTERVGMRRGRPILMVARVPDSMPFCHAIGLDVERWLQEGLLDILVAGGDFRLNRWEYSVALGERHDVPVYCDLDPAIRRGMQGRFNRNCIESYRARALNAWAAGADAVYTFNLFNPRSPVWWELGQPEGMRGDDQLYFVHVIGRAGYRQAGSVLAGGEQYDNLPLVHPQSPMRVEPGEAAVVPLRVAEKLTGPDVPEPRITCHVLSTAVAPPQVSLNDTPLQLAAREGGWCSYAVPADAMIAGDNTVAVTLPDEDQRGWEAQYECDANPPAPWRGGSASGCEATMQDDALLIADRSTETGSYLYYGYSWGSTPRRPAVFEARARVISGRSGIIMANGVAEDSLYLYPDRIEAVHADLSHEMDTTDDFHLYRLEIHEDDIRVYVDDELVIDGAGTFTYPAHSGRNVVSFGASSSHTTGEALWDTVRLRSGGRLLYDVVMEVDYPDEDA